ncbi:MAG: tRNA (cytidine(34)-2'-O)-methyltransferase [Candidatus Cloacimonetes bacterium]|nr:tRNA (cytidine(34)-2'-O)-methyltransferase [Candidatus Cloacimonadota bacterium]
MFNVVLWQPEIPANTGNIGRLCLGAGARLHIVRPMRFMVNDRQLRRAGLDYWRRLDVAFYDSLDELAGIIPPARTWLLSTKASRCYTEAEFAPGDALVFGPESRGLPADMLSAAPERCLRLPMTGEVRSLNLANTVAVALYEAWRQNAFRMPVSLPGNGTETHDKEEK